MLGLVGKLLLFFIFSFLFVFAIISLDSVVHLGLSEEIYNIFITPLLMVVYCIFLFSIIRKDFMKRFILKKQLHKVVCYPIIMSIVLVFVINSSRILPIFFGGEPTGVGSNQFTAIDELSPLGRFLFLSLFTGFTEEVLFRYLPFGVLFVLLNEFDKASTYSIKENIHVKKRSAKVVDFFIRVKEKLFIEKETSYLFCWVVITSIIFSLAHGPNLTNFHFYFIAGLVNGWFFIKYGFLAAWISHASFNALSGPAMMIIINLLF